MVEVTKSEKKTIKGNAEKKGKEDDEVKYEATFDLPKDFGNVGAVLVQNEHRKEMFLQSIEVDGFPGGPVLFSCNSWIHSKHDSPTKRVFFTNKVCTS